jgi:mono/diheme cytochrome c family protein
MRAAAQQFRVDRFAAALLVAWLVIFSASAYAQAKTPSNKKATIAPSPGGNSAAIARGHIVYKDRCAICHFSESDTGKIGPGLKGLYKRGKFADAGRVDDATIENRILNGGKDMPPFRSVLTAGQVRDLMAYLKTLQ